jgi:hypothetical protein
VNRRIFLSYGKVLDSGRQCKENNSDEAINAD